MEQFYNFIELILGQKLSDSPGLKRAFKNIIWLILDKGFCLGLSFIISIWLARYLGPAQFGIFNYAFSFIFMFSILGHLGLNEILIRDIIRTPEKTCEILGCAFFLKTLAYSLAFLAIIISSYFINSLDNISHRLISILAVSILFQGIEIVDIYFLSQVSSRYVVKAKISTFFIFSIIIIFFIYQKASLITFIWIFMAEFVSSWIILLAVYQWKTHSIQLWQLSYARTKQLLFEGFPIFVAAIAWSIFIKIDLIFLKHFVSNEAVGTYTAACKISEIGILIGGLVLSSFFPIIVQLKHTNENLYKQKIKRIFTLITILSFIFSITIFIFSKSIVLFLYGSAYLAAVPILRVYVFNVVLISLSIGMSYFLIAEGLLKKQMLRLVLSSILGILLNLLLIPLFGPIGAAAAMLSGVGSSIVLGLSKGKDAVII